MKNLLDGRPFLFQAGSWLTGGDNPKSNHFDECDVPRCGLPHAFFHIV